MTDLRNYDPASPAGREGRPSPPEFLAKKKKKKTNRPRKNREGARQGMPVEFNRVPAARMQKKNKHLNEGRA